MIALLIAGGVVYLALGDWRDALILLVFASLSIVITVYQETRTERVLEALRDLTSPRALVTRDGERKRIPGREVARGDTVVLAEGDRVPADAALVECEDLQVDELLLTGESAPVRKIVRPAVGSDGRVGPVGTTCLTSFPDRWSFAAPESRKWSPQAPQAKSARSANRSARWKPSLRACKRK